MPLFYASRAVSRRSPQNSRSGWNRYPFSCRTLSFPTSCRFIRRTAPLHRPRTDQDKAISRLNAIRHTLCSQTVVSSKNNLSAYAAFQKRFFDDLQPVGIIEVQLTQTLLLASQLRPCL